MIKYVVECYFPRNGYCSYKTLPGIRFRLAHLHHKIGIQLNHTTFPWDPNIQNAFLFNSEKDAEDAREYVKTNTRVVAVVIVGNKVWKDRQVKFFTKLNIRQLTSILSRYSIIDCLETIDFSEIENHFIQFFWKHFAPWMRLLKRKKSFKEKIAEIFNKN